MNSPDPTAVILSLSIPLILTIVAVLIAYREKDKIGYLVAMIPFLMFLVVVSFILNQHVLGIILFASAFVVAMVSLSRVRKFQERKIRELLAKHGKEMGSSAPLRTRDIFITKTGWLGFAYKYGAARYVLLLWLFMVPCLSGFLFALNLWLRNMDAGSIVSYTVTFSTGIAVMTYATLKSVLEKNHQETEEPSEAKVTRNAEELYEQLLHAYTRFYGEGRLVLEDEIKSFMKQGLSREEAITKIAEKEKL